MRGYSLTHLSDASLLHALTTLVARDHVTTATLLAHIAEVDERKLYLPAGHSSMFGYCVEGLRLSEDAAFKRIQAARAARRFPRLFEAVAAGALNLTTVNLLAPHLTEANAGDLIAGATHKRKAEVEALLAARFPRSEFLAIGQTTPAPVDAQLAPAQVELTTPQLAPAQVAVANSLPSQTPKSPFAHQRASRSRLEAVATERYLLHVPIDRATYDKLEHATALLSHTVPSGDMAAVLDRALDSLIERLERRKCAKTGRSLPRRSRDPRHVPAHVRRAVWERDRGQCTFVGDTGHRCGERTRLEFDHVEPVARGGTASVATIRLRCRAHNQYEAERMFGSEFMRGKRAAARRAASSRQSDVARGAAVVLRGEATPARVASHEAEDRARDAERTRDLLSALRELGFRAEESQRAMTFVASMPDATLEESVRAALRFLRPRQGVRTLPGVGAGGGREAEPPSRIGLAGLSPLAIDESIPHRTTAKRAFRT